MRIGHVLPYDLRQPGGVQTHTLALSDALTAFGHESSVFAPARPLRLSLGGTRADLALHPRDLLALRAFLCQPHDVLHIQEPLLPLLGPLSLLHPTPAPTVVTLHSAEPLARRVYGSMQPLGQRLLLRADAVVCASEVSRETAGRAVGRQAVVIPPCLDLAPFQCADSAEPAAPDPEQPTILFVGRDEPRKGLPVLLEALRRLPDAALIIAGPVSERTRQRADPRATFLGPVPHAQIPALMAQATCAAFPALGGEALGLVLIEALAAGVPVSASDIPGYRIAADGGRAALLSPPCDADALAANLARLLTDDRLRAALVERGKAAAQRFDARAVAQQHLDLYRSLRPRSAAQFS